MTFTPDPRSVTPVMEHRCDSATARLTSHADRRVVDLRVAGGKHHGAVGEAGAATMERAVRLAIELGVPFVARLDTTGADVREGVSSLHGWGRCARALVDASGVVPTIIIVTGACVSGPALCLGLVDHVIMTTDALAYVSGTDAVEALTGVRLDQDELGGVAVHGRTSGVAAIVVDDEAHADELLAVLLAYAPSHHLDDAPRWHCDDPVDRDTSAAAEAVPDAPSASYDVRTVVGDVVDADSLLELRPDHAANIVTALARLDGRPVGVVANQPFARAGALDIDASRKAARFVQWCDAFNLPIVTFVDTPGFEPGKDLEWRGMIRQGAQLVHAYAEATVPRLCVVLRKAYGGAYIVMDSKELGNDYCIAWAGAQIAVMGAPAGVQILHGKRLAGLEGDTRDVEQARLLDEYAARFDHPYAAAERGYVDVVIDPRDTRRTLVAALGHFVAKRERGPERRHSNIPL